MGRQFCWPILFTKIFARSEFKKRINLHAEERRTQGKLNNIFNEEVFCMQKLYTIFSQRTLPLSLPKFHAEEQRTQGKLNNIFN